MKDNKPLAEIISTMDTDDLAKIIELFARQNPELEKMIRNAAAGKDAAYEAIKADIAVIKKSRRFYDWRSRNELYEQLESILENIRINIKDAESAVDLLVKFFALDEKCCNNCDDSDGGLGYEFNSAAVKVFSQFSPDYKDKEKLTQIIFDLLENNHYGCHDGVLKHVAELLPQENIRTLMTKKFTHDYIMPDLAFAVNDAPLLEKLLREMRPDGQLWGEAFYEVALCYLNYGDAKKALEFADQIDTHYWGYKKSEILEKIYLATDDKNALKNFYCEDFFSSPSESTAEKIKNAFGDDFFKILAEHYEASDLKKIKKICSPLTQTIIFRVPLNYYLDNAKSKFYSSAAKHLKTLDDLAAEIKDWRGVEAHSEYKKKLEEKHFRKYAFWEKYR
ncbi:DUF6880 family protein [Treponema sp.]|uniref:DUF6880 family protein n=1 Tax=Treponema sp. TaxID=166 RepID=UPI00388D3FFD